MTLVGWLTIELGLPPSDLSVHLGEPFGEVFDGRVAVPKAYGLLGRLMTIIGEVCGVGLGVVTVEDAVVDEPFEDALGRPV